MTGAGDLDAEIRSLLDDTEAAWNSQDWSNLRALWDSEDPNPFYLAGEQDDWFVSWPAVDDYLGQDGQGDITEAIRVRFYNVRTRRLSDDLAFAGYWMRTDMKLKFAPRPFGSDNRVSAVFRRRPEGWRYLCYTEAFQAPNLYFQRLFEKDVSDDYDAFYREVKARRRESGGSA